MSNFKSAKTLAEIAQRARDALVQTNLEHARKIMAQKAGQGYLFASMEVDSSLANQTIAELSKQTDVKFYSTYTAINDGRTTVIKMDWSPKYDK